MAGERVKVDRAQALEIWGREALAHLGVEQSAELLWQAVSGDASFRRYFRLSGACGQWILMDAPPEHEDCRPFLRIADTWYQAGIRVPQVLAKDLAQGFLLLEDFGDQLLRIDLETQDPLLAYQGAFAELARIQTLSMPSLPEYDRALLRREMSLFPDWFLSQLLGLTLTQAEQEILHQVEERLILAALAQPQVVVHRDYHSRNLLSLPTGAVGVIDFQDAVIGALTYDLVSLLKDSYVEWSEAQVAACVDLFYQQYLPTAMQAQVSRNDFHRAFHWMGMQRQLKVCGIFARLYLRDGKAGYLADIPRTLNYLLRAASSFPEFAEFSHWLSARVLPALQQHPLYSEQVWPEGWAK
jgi:N-acetylmuramate 1-kinase